MQVLNYDKFLFDHLLNIREDSIKKNGLVVNRSKYQYYSEIFLYNFSLKVKNKSLKQFPKFEIDDEDIPYDIKMYKYKDILIKDTINKILKKFDKYNVLCGMKIDFILI